MHLAEEVAFNEILQREREELAGEDDVAAIRRERDRMRQRNSRLCRKYGLPSRRDRQGGAWRAGPRGAGGRPRRASLAGSLRPSGKKRAPCGARLQPFPL